MHIKAGNGLRMQDLHDHEKVRARSARRERKFSKSRRAVDANPRACDGRFGLLVLYRWG
jgi:hypothetical protein